MAVRLIRTLPESEGATKLLLATASGVATFEAVLLRFADDDGVCMSSQAGCSFRCLHCATTFSPEPFVAQLDWTEIVDGVEAVLSSAGLRQVVFVDFSGVGDASANWYNVMRAGIEMQRRRLCQRVKVTTLAPRAWVRHVLRIESWRPARFLFSLHGATAALRRQLVPNADDPAAVLPLWAELAKETPVSVNYVLHGGNSDEDAADALADLLEPYEGHFRSLHLAPLNPVGGSPITPSVTAESFLARIRARMPRWEVRCFRPLGRAQAAACGQLRGMRGVA